MKTQSKNTMLAMALFIGSMAFQSCEKHDDNHQHTDEGELITKVEVYLVDSLTKDTLFAAWSDKDGIGGNNPILPDTFKLKQGKMYFGRVKFYTNHDAISYHDITEEILNEGVNHIICYNVQSIVMPSTSLFMIRTDEDVNKKVLGFQTEWYAPSTFDQGTVNIRLKHQPGIKDGTCDPGETDVEVNFPYLVK